MSDLNNLIEQELKGSRVPLDKTKPLALAYLGDTILDLYVRSRLVMSTTLHPKEMHKKASSMVNAASQAAMMRHLMDILTEEECAIFKHARNAHSGTIPKNQSPVDYKWATGMEALLGHLYLTHQEERLYTLMHEGITYLESQKGEGSHE